MNVVNVSPWLGMETLKAPFYMAYELLSKEAAMTESFPNERRRKIVK